MDVGINKFKIMSFVHNLFTFMLYNIGKKNEIGYN